MLDLLCILGLLCICIVVGPFSVALSLMAIRVVYEMVEDYRKGLW